jgi:hypothetical protein
MKRTSFHLLSGLIALVTACGAGQEGGAPGVTATPEALSSASRSHPHLDCAPADFDGVPEEIEDQLEIARKSVCRFRRIEAALAAGYHDSGLACVPGQGYHFIKDSLVGTFNIREPSVLMYTSSGDLNGPEWIAPVSTFPTPPSIFGQTLHAEDELGLWILHVWVWKLNPNGVFDDINPNVTCP